MTTSVHLRACAGRFLVLEEYGDESAALTHNETAVDLLAQVGETARLVSAEVYGHRVRRFR